MHNYKELNIWKKSIKMATEVYKITAQFPASERYELTSQVKRAVVSIASNIAEGAGRNSNNEFIYFLGIANGSSFELVTQLTISAELGLVSYDNVNPVIDELEQIQKMIYGFKETLKNQKKKIVRLSLISHVSNRISKQKKQKLCQQQQQQKNF